VGSFLRLNYPLVSRSSAASAIARTMSSRAMPGVTGRAASKAIGWWHRMVSAVLTPAACPHGRQPVAQSSAGQVFSMMRAPLRSVILALRQRLTAAANPGASARVAVAARAAPDSHARIQSYSSAPQGRAGGAFDAAKLAMLAATSAASVALARAQIGDRAAERRGELQEPFRTYRALAFLPCLDRVIGDA
jgi:hypothetical protein